MFFSPKDQGVVWLQTQTGQRRTEADCEHAKVLTRLKMKWGERTDDVFPPYQPVWAWSWPGSPRSHMHTEITSAQKHKGECGSDNSSVECLKFVISWGFFELSWVFLIFPMWRRLAGMQKVQIYLMFSAVSALKRSWLKYRKSLMRWKNCREAS